MYEINFSEDIKCTVEKIQLPLILNVREENFNFCN